MSTALTVMLGLVAWAVVIVFVLALCVAAAGRARTPAATRAWALTRAGAAAHAGSLRRRLESARQA